MQRLAWVCRRLDRVSDPSLEHDEERVREEIAELKALTVDCQRAMLHWLLRGEPLSERGEWLKLTPGMAMAMPGTLGRAELLVSSAHQNSVALGVRDSDGRMLVPHRTMKPDEEFELSIYGSSYRIRLNSIHCLEVGGEVQTVTIRLFPMAAAAKHASVDSPAVREGEKETFVRALAPASLDSLLNPEANDLGWMPLEAQVVAVLAQQLDACAKALDDARSLSLESPRTLLRLRIDDALCLARNVGAGLIQMLRLRNKLAGLPCMSGDLGLAIVQCVGETDGRRSSHVRFKVVQHLRAPKRYGAWTDRGREFPELVDDEVIQQSSSGIDLKVSPLERSFTEGATYLLAYTPAISAGRYFSSYDNSKLTRRVVLAVELN